MCIKNITLKTIDSNVSGFIFFNTHCVLKSLLFEPLLSFIEKLYSVYSRSKFPSGFTCVCHWHSFGTLNEQRHKNERRWLYFIFMKKNNQTPFCFFISLTIFSLLDQRNNWKMKWLKDLEAGDMLDYCLLILWSIWASVMFKSWAPVCL